MSAPLTGPPAGALGVSQLRFLDTHDGWAFGPQLWVTHDGGGHWTQEQTYGLRVTDLETAGDRAFAVFATCTGTGAGLRGGLHQLLALLGPGERRPVAARARADREPAGGLGQARPRPPAWCSPAARADGTGYLLSPSGALLSGPLTGKPWSVVSKAAPCTAWRAWNRRPADRGAARGRLGPAGPGLHQRDQHGG